jgi:hypothetical protein
VDQNPGIEHMPYFGLEIISLGRTREQRIAVRMAHNLLQASNERQSPNALTTCPVPSCASTSGGASMHRTRSTRFCRIRDTEIKSPSSFAKQSS